MSSITFDTLAYSKRLREAGFTEQQAEAQTQAQQQVMQDILGSQIATKGDINGLEKRIKDEIHNLKIQIAVLKWMMGVMLAGVLSLVLKAFFM
jgi:hypothetical protein